MVVWQPLAHAAAVGPDGQVAAKEWALAGSAVPGAAEAVPRAAVEERAGVAGP